MLLQVLQDQQQSRDVSMQIFGIGDADDNVSLLPTFGLPDAINEAIDVLAHADSASCCVRKGPR